MLSRTIKHRNKSHDFFSCVATPLHPPGPIQDGKVKTNLVINTNWKTILFCRRGVLVRKEK